MRISKLLTVAAVMAIATISTANATVLFSDDFNRANSDTVGNSWTEIGEDADDVSIFGNSMLLRDNNGNGTISASATRILSTSGYNSITLSFDWAPLEPSDTGDTLFAEWRIGNSAWTTATGGTILATLDLGGAASFASSGTLFLDASANNLANIEIRFRTLVSNGTPGADEGALIDNVVVSGTAITSTAVPEPLSLSLFGAGVAGVGLVRRRLKRNAAKA